MGNWWKNTEFVIFVSCWKSVKFSCKETKSASNTKAQLIVKYEDC